MNKFILGVTAAGLLASAHASAANLTPGLFASTGQVVQDNGTNCSQVGLTTGSANNSVINYPGASKPGFILYVPGAGSLQLCNSFANVPAGGLNGFTSNAQCAVYSVNGNIPAQSVNFQFSLTTTDANSGVGTTTVTIPTTNVIGGGCVATVATSIVRSGK